MAGRPGEGGADCVGARRDRERQPGARWAGRWGGSCRRADRGDLPAIGCEVVFEEVLPGRPNVIASLHRDDAYPTLVIEGHTDTVGGPSAEPRIDGGRLVGRGACDTKGGIAAALHALERLAAIDIRLNVHFVGTVDEEVGFAGVTHYVQNHPRADAAIVLEPTSLVPVVAHAGVLRGELRAEGRAAAQRDAELGENAITALVEAIPGIALVGRAARAERARALRPHVVLGDDDPRRERDQHDPGRVRRRVRLAPAPVRRSRVGARRARRPARGVRRVAGLRLAGGRRSRSRPRRAPRGGRPGRVRPRYRSSRGHRCEQVLACRHSGDRARAGLARAGAHRRRVDRDRGDRTRRRALRRAVSRVAEHDRRPRPRFLEGRSPSLATRRSRISSRRWRATE